MILSTPACKKCKDPSNPDCDNYDPCYGSSEVSADFRIFETRGQADCVIPDIESNTFTDLSFVRFTANQDLDEYHWIVGAETINSKSFIRRGFPRGISTAITLIGYREPNKRCHPADDGWDTVTKNIYCLDKIYSFKEPIYDNICLGWYNGYNISNPSDTFTFGYGIYDNLIRGSGGSGTDTFTLGYFENIPVKGLNSKSNRQFPGGYLPHGQTANSNCFSVGSGGFADSTGKLSVSGLMYTLDSGRSIRFEYKYYTANGNITKHYENVFIGKKVK